MIYFCCIYSNLKYELTGEYDYVSRDRLVFTDTEGTHWFLANNTSDYYILIDNKKYFVETTCTDFIEKIGNDLYKRYTEWHNKTVEQAIDKL